MLYFIGLLQLLATSILVTYVKKKAGNQADKEDLKELTTIVEEVKMTTGKELEILKASLDVNTSRRKELFNIEKEAVVKFYVLIYQFVFVGLRIQPEKYIDLDKKEITRKLEELRNSLDQITLANGEVDLFVNDDETLKNAMELGGIALKFKVTVELHLLKLLIKLDLRERLECLKKQHINVEQTQKDIKIRNKTIGLPI